MVADANALTYLNLQDAVLGRRFPPASQRTNSKRWLATAYQDVWSADDWTFKRVSLENLTVPAAVNTPTMPAAFGDVIALYDAQGMKLMQLSQERFERNYEGSLLQGGSGYADSFMVTNGQIYLSAVPGASTYKLSYYRRLASRTTALAVQAGMMSDNADFPLWDDHHSVLIPRAMAIGLIELNDPTWELSQNEYERQLARMRDDQEQGNPALQWAAANWDY